MSKIMPDWTKTPPTPVNIAVLLFDSFSNLCLANCLEPLRAANTMTGRHAFDWRILTPDGAPVLSSSGMQVVPHAALPTLRDSDYLFITASYDHERYDTAGSRHALRRASRNAAVSVGLDAGPWLMAAAGLLDGKRATVHWDLIDPFTERFPKVTAEQARVLRDGNRITCAGAMSALDLTLGLISTHLGEAARLDVEALFIHGDPPVGRSADRHAARDPLLRRALSAMRENVERPLSVNELSSLLSCQPRTLNRRFQTGLGAAPGTVYRHLRLGVARKLLEGSQLGIAEVALRCGYESPAAMTRAFRKVHGVAPSRLRKHPP